MILLVEVDLCGLFMNCPDVLNKKVVRSGFVVTNIARIVFNFSVHRVDVDFQVGGSGSAEIALLAREVPNVVMDRLLVLVQGAFLTGFVIAV